MDGKWTDEEKMQLAKGLAVLATIQKSYGRQVDVKATIQAWEFIMADKYRAEQVLMAMRVYMGKSSDMPAPADLIKIISPPAAPITYAEYKNALEQHALEGYPMFGFYGQKIKDYQKQQSSDSDVPTHQEILEKRNEPLAIDVSKLLSTTYGGKNG
jgi:hypothetical protein